MKKENIKLTNDQVVKELINSFKMYPFTNTVVFYSEEIYKDPKQKKNFIEYLEKFLYISLGKEISVEVRMPTEECCEGTLNTAYYEKNDKSGKGLTLADLLGI